MEQNLLTGRRLGTRELRIFLAVADTRSMAKAAKVLGTSQPAISKAIADMEYAESACSIAVQRALSQRNMAAFSLNAVSPSSVS